MEGIVEILETATNVFATMDIMEATANTKLTNVKPIHVKMEELAKIWLELTNVIVHQDTKEKIATSMLMIAIPTHVRTTGYVMIWSMIFDVLVLMVPLEFYVKSMSTNVSKELVTMVALVLIK